MKRLNGMIHVCFKKIRITDTSNKEIDTLFKLLKIIKGQNEKDSNFFLKFKRSYPTKYQRTGIK